MRRFLLDTGIAGDYIDRRRGVFERTAMRSPAGTGSASEYRSWRSWPSESS